MRQVIHPCSITLRTLRRPSCHPNLLFSWIKNAVFRLLPANSWQRSSRKLNNSSDYLFLQTHGRANISSSIWALTKASRLAPPAPRNVGSNEEGPPEATKHSQKDERDELKQVPRCVVLNIEQHQAAVTKRVDGAQDEGCHEGSKKWAPQRLEREVVAHLEEMEFTRLVVVGKLNSCSRHWWCVCCTSSKLKSTPPMGAPKATDTPAADAAERT